MVSRFDSWVVSRDAGLVVHHTRHAGAVATWLSGESLSDFGPETSIKRGLDCTRLVGGPRYAPKADADEPEERRWWWRCRRVGTTHGCGNSSLRSTGAGDRKTW